MPADASPLESSASHAIPIDDKPRAIPRIVSLIALVGVLVLTGLLFFRVMALFLVPLFLAGVLVVVFEPVFKWFACKLPGKKSLPALCTTVVILLAVLIPCVLLGWRAYVEVAEFAASAKPPTPSVAAEQPNPARPLDQRNIFIQLWNADYDAVLKNAESVDSQEAAELPPAARFAAAYEKLLGKPLDNAEFARVKRQLAAIAGEEGPHSLLVGLKLVGSIGLGLLVMTVAVFYFFVDGPAMIKTMMHLSPLDDAYEEELLERFSQVSRAVVVATVLSAVVQGLLAGIGYFFVLDGGPLFLLTVTTMVMAMVPFVGAMAVWGFVAVVLFIQGNTVAAVGLAIYGAAIVSTVDNVIKPIVLHGQSKLHPLLALLSVLGGVTALGPIGILVGPMLVAFLQALLTMLRKELESLEEEGRLSMGPGRPPQPEPLAAGGEPTPTSHSDDPELDCK